MCSTNEDLAGKATYTAAGQIKKG